jgi:hypothetical protein
MNTQAEGAFPRFTNSLAATLLCKSLLDRGSQLARAGTSREADRTGR